MSDPKLPPVEDFRLIDLSGLEAVAWGQRCLVFEHPGDPALLIKVMRPESFGPDGQPLRRKRHKVRRREGVFLHFSREIAEYVAVRASAGPSVTRQLVSPVRGLAETSLGLGLVVEKATDRHGDLAPTLRKLLERGELDAAKRARLDAFFDALIRHHVVLYEFTGENIVYSDDGKDSARFVCVDGLGSRTLVPFKVWCKAANARKIRKGRRQIEALVESFGAEQVG